MGLTDREDQIILANAQLEAAQIVDLLQRQLGGIYNKRTIQKRRKKLVDHQSPGASPIPYPQLAMGQGNLGAFDDPNSTVNVDIVEGESALVLSDIHAPYQDEDAFSIALSIARDLHPTHVFAAGDVVDFAAISTFAHPYGTPTSDEEMSAGREIFVAIEYACPDSIYHFLEGNHENRRRKAIAESSIKRLGQSSIRGLQEPECLDIENWHLYGYKQDVLLGDFVITHGEYVVKGAGESAQKEMMARLQSGISGHSHRAGSSRFSTRNNELFWFENGCLCRKDVPYVSSRGEDWQHAFSVLYYDGTRMHVNQINILDYKAYFNGRLYTPGS